MDTVTANYCCNLISNDDDFRKKIRYGISFVTVTESAARRQAGIGRGSMQTSKVRPRGCAGELRSFYCRPRAKSLESCIVLGYFTSLFVAFPTLDPKFSQR